MSAHLQVLSLSVLLGEPRRADPAVADTWRIEGDVLEVRYQGRNLVLLAHHPGSPGRSAPMALEPELALTVALERIASQANTTERLRDELSLERRQTAALADAVRALAGAIHHGNKLDVQAALAAAEGLLR